MKRAFALLTVAFLLPLVSVMLCTPADAAPAWVSPNRYRVILTVNPGSLARKNSPAKADIYFQNILNSQGANGTFDEHTIEVVAYNAAGQPKVFDSTRGGYEQYLLPWRVQKYYPTNQVTLSFVMPDHTYTTYCVYFDTKESGLGKPQRYPGIVGDGDWFTDGYARREINACSYDYWCDFDGDGDLDLLKGGAEPYVFFYENVGGNKFVDRGRLTNNGSLMEFPKDGVGRSWHSVSLCDWDGDGDQDLFIYSPTGPWPPPSGQETTINKLIRYENTTVPGGPLTWTYRGIVKTVSGNVINGTVTFVDWNGNGKMDIVGSEGGLIVVYLNASPDNSLANLKVADGFYVQANGQLIDIETARVELADIDNDGDMDMFVGSEEGRVYFFENVGTRSQPVFTQGRIIAFYEYMDSRSRVKVHDWDGDGLLDFVVGRFWERTQWGEQPRLYGRLYKNIGTPTNPKFEARDAFGGSPYTERFQIADAVRQNGVRSVDWNNDGKMDLIASDTDGFVWLFRNTTNQLFPVFTTGEKLLSDGVPIRMYGEEQEKRAAGYARCDVADWNNDGKKDLLVADGRGYLFLYLNIGTDANPVFGPGQRVKARNIDGSQYKPIDGNGRASVLVCDWDRDGKNDIIFGMYGYRPEPFRHRDIYSKYYNWPWQTDEPWNDDGFLFYKNVGTNENPILDYPSWIRIGPTQEIIKYSRPNLGSFVYWNNDTNPDFIAAEFENSIKYYRNTASSGAPYLQAAVDIVRPDCAQMISGAHAIDWNGDGDIDILTGQGHGGSGLRFYERDYINDFTSNGNLYPFVSVGASTQGLDISEAALQINGASVIVPKGVVSAVFSGYFYIQSETSPNGIRVQKASHGMTVGMRVDVEGTMATTEHGERYISAVTLSPNGSGSISALTMNTKAIGGADKSFNPLTGAGQRGVTDGLGANNIGLLVKVLGRCAANVRGDFDGKKYIFIDDGSGVTSLYRASNGSYVEVNGVKVEVDDAGILEGDYIAARGISSIEKVDDVYQSRILPRVGAGDIVKL